LERVRKAVPEADILVVDDNSPDGTADLADEAGTRLGQITVLRRPKKIGLGDAYRAGFSVGIERGYDVIVQMDADLSHDPSELPKMFAALDAGADAVIGSRYIPGGSIPNWPWHRRALSKWGNRYTAIVTGMPIKDATSGYRAYRADMLKAIDFGTTRAKGYGFQMETAYRVRRAGGKIVEVPITFTDRVKGESKLTLSVAAEELTLVTWWGVRDRVFHRS
jgi:dolichol-phosphate mannosyltransferase